MAITRLGGANAITGTLPAANINDTSIGNITALPAGVGGKVLQVVNATDTTERTTTSSSFTAAGTTLSVDITPSSTSSKIFIVVTSTTHANSALQARYFTIYRDSTNLGQVNNGMTALYIEANPGDPVTPLVMSYLDSPSSTSQITYQIRLKTTGGTGYLNWNSTRGSITAYEIAG